MPTFLQNTSFTVTGPDFYVALILYFYLFAVFGWFVEMLYLSTSGRGLINSGFLQGPVCPAYAAGVLIIYPFTLLFAPLAFWLQIILYAGLATAVEYLAHFSLEKTLGIRIWDYSDEFMNFQGRISLKYTVFWLFLVLLLVLVLQPGAIFLIESLPSQTRLVLAIVLGVLLIGDYILSGIMFGSMTKRISAICTTFGLPDKEMQELQFNRPRIMNEKKRLAKLFANPEYQALDAMIEERLFTQGHFDSFGFRLSDSQDIIEHPSYKAWKNSTPEATRIFNRYLRAAELTYGFCQAAGLNGKAAARGMIMAAYLSDTKKVYERVFDFFVPQERILFAIRKDVIRPNRIEKDVLLRYKWPLNFGPPLTKECLLASFAEKIVNSKEFRPVLRDLYAKVLA